MFYIKFLTMDCINCKTKICRKKNSCNQESFSADHLISAYRDDEHVQKIIQTSASLVDNRRAGTLTRLEELAEFINTMGYKKVGLAYCYGMEAEAQAVKEYLEQRVGPLINVSCSVGALAQKDINAESSKTYVACNPIGQAQELNNSGVDFAIMMGLCIGHDVLFNRTIQCDSTTLVVKDRVNAHNPMAHIKQLMNNE